MACERERGKGRGGFFRGGHGKGLDCTKEGTEPREIVGAA
jgi:hypothetical protein